MNMRGEFPALAHWTYLNTATYGQVPKRAVEASSRHYARRDELACSDFLAWFDDADAIRGSIARLIHCEASDIAFFPNAATPLSLLINGVDWKPGDRVLTCENEFPNHPYWGEVLAERGVAFDEVPFGEWRRAVTERTRLVMVSTVNYTTGQRADLASLPKGPLLYVDGTQSLGALRFDCAVVQPDMFAVDGYKWLLCPNGAGFAYISPATRRWLKPAVVGWRSDRRWREVNALHQGKPEFSQSAEKYEGAMIPFPVIYAMGASVDMMLELGPEAIEARVLELAAYTRRQLESLGASLIPSPLPSAILAARFEGCDSAALVARLKQQRILIASRHGNLRISTHFYNNEQDVDRLIAALRQML